ncbi:MAG TPA: HD domain-containing phosphohydrolase [Candidatus Angelobacter sp.]|nr:HD domain-containing phosphohydrolase [Candidatus Angelobacter sp.]
MLELTRPTAARILIADDDEMNRFLAEEMLAIQGYQVIHAEDGATAMEKFTHHAPDLVLLDVMMPRLNGFEVCRRIKQNPDTCLTPVVLVTGLSATEDRIRGIESGADDFLTRPVDRVELLARVRSLIQLKNRTDELERAESVLYALALSIEAKDAYTEGHCERLSAYSSRLAEQLHFPPEYINALRRAGTVHDIGKVAVPDSILLKPARLTEEEWKIMREHPVVGERICTPLRSFRLVLPIIRHHHEKCDGSGYPDGLCRHNIPVAARVLQIVDVYDALTTARPYKRALSTAEALQTMQEEVQKGWWDPEIFGEFRQFITTPLELDPHHMAAAQ